MPSDISHGTHNVAVSTVSTVQFSNLTRHQTPLLHVWCCPLVSPFLVTYSWPLCVNMISSTKTEYITYHNAARRTEPHAHNI